MSYTEKQLATELENREGWLLQQEGIVGTALGCDQGGQICIKIYTDGATSETKAAISARLQKLPFEFEETGEIRAF